MSFVRSFSSIVLTAFVSISTVADVPVWVQPGQAGGVRASAIYGDLLAVGGSSGVNLWNFRTRELVRRMPELSNSECLHFSGDGSLLGSTTGAELRIWSMKDATLVSIGEMAKDVTDFAFLATKVVTFDRQNSAARLWDLDSGELIRKIEVPEGNYIWAVTPSGSYLALAVLKEIYVYDFDGVGKRVFSGHTDFVEALAFSADGQILASGTG